MQDQPPHGPTYWRPWMHWPAFFLVCLIGNVVGQSGYLAIMGVTVLWFALTVGLWWSASLLYPDRRGVPTWFSVYWLYSGATIGMAWVIGWISLAWSYMP